MSELIVFEKNHTCISVCSVYIKKDVAQTWGHLQTGLFCAVLQLLSKQSCSFQFHPFESDDLILAIHAIATTRLELALNIRLF